jgi:drug/metabolite transporter (DMT)-like permease
MGSIDVRTAVRIRPLLGAVMMVSASALFAGNGTVSKLVLQAGVEPPQLTALRAGGAALGLLALSVLLAPGPRRLRLTPSDLPLLMAYGLAGFFCVPFLYFVAIERLPVGIGLLLEYTAPVFVALWVRFGQRQSVRPRLWGGLLLCLLGLGLVAEVWRELRLAPVGMAAGLGAAVLLAVYYLLGARGVARRDPLSLCGWAFGVAALAGLPVLAWRGVPLAALSSAREGVPVWALLACVVVFGSIAPYLLVAAALRHLPATSAGIIGTVEPVMAAGVAWFALGEILTGFQILGCALVLVGVALAETARTVRPGEAPEPRRVLACRG